MLSLIEQSDIKFVLSSVLKFFIGFFILNKLERFFEWWIIFIACWVSYFALGAWMMYYIKKNRLELIKMNYTKTHIYEQAESSSRDLFVLLPAIVWVTEFFQIPILLTDPVQVSSFYSNPLCWLMIPISMFIGLIWRMVAHRALHHPSVYRKWHKQHHVRPDLMSAYSSFNDHWVEFVVMETVGTFYLPVLLNPLPFPLFVLMWSYQCFSGIHDHSNAKGGWIDAEYHLTHHQLTIYNYAEFEFLDYIVGTLYTGDSKFKNDMKNFHAIDEDLSLGSFDGKQPSLESIQKKCEVYKKEN